MRTDTEVTAATLREHDLALRCAELTRQRDRARDLAVALEAETALLRQALEMDVSARHTDAICSADDLLDLIAGWGEERP